MAHLGKESRFQVGQAFERFLILVKLSVESDHAAVGLVELARVHLGDLGLSLAQLLQGAQQLLVLLLKFFQEALRFAVRESFGDIFELGTAERAEAWRQLLGHRELGPAAGARFDGEAVHHPLSAADPERDVAG